jgi:uncharacterized membrane protein (UPF0127 family)
MKIWVAILTALFASLLLVAGCGGGGSSSRDENGASTAPAGITRATTTASGPDGGTTVTIVSSDGTRTDVEVEIADDDAERQRGLMDRTALADNAGMLFVFDREKPLSFWMRNTLIPLSVAYIDSDGRIVDIQDMQPLDETPHPSAGPARYALEVNQGFFAARGIGVGDEVEIPDLRDSSG